MCRMASIISAIRRVLDPQSDREVWLHAAALVGLTLLALLLFGGEP